LGQENKIRKYKTEKKRGEMGKSNKSNRKEKKEKRKKEMKRNRTREEKWGGKTYIGVRKRREEKRSVNGDKGKVGNFSE
jgi:hypothetical protein